MASFKLSATMAVTDRSDVHPDGIFDDEATMHRYLCLAAALTLAATAQAQPAPGYQSVYAQYRAAPNSAQTPDQVWRQANREVGPATPHAMPAATMDKTPAAKPEVAPAAAPDKAPAADPHAAHHH
jgi:hypothetical protein